MDSLQSTGTSINQWPHKRLTQGKQMSSRQMQVLSQTMETAMMSNFLNLCERAKKPDRTFANDKVTNNLLMDQAALT